MKDMRYTMLLDFYLPMLTQKQQELMDLYYNQDLSLGEIAESYGISRQAVMDGIKRSQNALNEMEQKLGLAKKYGTIHQDLETCIALNLAGEREALHNKLLEIKKVWEEDDGI